MTDVLADLHERERLLHVPAPGTTREELAAGVVDGYWEVGASGGVFGLDVIWDVVQRRAAGDPSAWGDLGAEPPWITEDEQVREVAPGAYLLTYLLDQGGRRTRRATLWLRDGETWRAAYHQGTVVTGRW